MKNISIKISDGFHKLLKLYVAENNLEIKETIIELLKEKMGIDFEGKQWHEVKHILGEYVYVDKENVDAITGDCIVDFSNEFSEYSVDGVISKEYGLSICHTSRIYKNII